MEKNLEVLGKDYQWLERELSKMNIKPEEALIATLDGKGKIFCQKKGE